MGLSDNILSSENVNGTCATMHSLASKYENFLVPSRKIKIGGKDITAIKGIAVDEVSVILSVSSASSAIISISNAYDLETNSFSSDLKKNLKPGLDVSVELGYGSKLSEVFVGYIEEINMKFGEMPVVEIVAMDARRLMMINRKAFVVYEDSKYEDIINKVLNPYKKLCKNIKVDNINLTPSGKVVRRNSSDYEFICGEIQNRTNHEMLVIGPTVYFRKLNSDIPKCVSLEWGSGIISLEGTVSYKDCKVVVAGKDSKSTKLIKAEKSVKSAVTSVSPISGGLTIEYSYPEISDEGEAKTYAANKSSLIARESRSVKGECIGLPEILPGTKLSVSKMDSMINTDYYLIEVVHSFTGKSYTTGFSGCNR